MTTEQAETLLSTVQNIKIYSISPHVTHLFASSTETSYGTLEDIIRTADQLSNSLNHYLSAPLSNPKLVSLLRQQSAISHSLHLSDQNVRQTIDALRNRSGISYGEDIPLDRGSLPEWCISRFETWGTAAGMEAFKDDGREGGVSLVLGGKVLVVDVDFSIDKTTPSDPRATVASVKTSYAIANDASGSPTTEGSISLDAFLLDSMQQFCVEAHKEAQDRDPLEAARLGTIILHHLRYLVMLDKLAERKNDGGIRWFVDVDQLCSTLEKFAKSEAQTVASSLSLPRTPLDIFLLRSHALPLPYLSLPSISFLAYLSPLAYLTLLRNFPEDAVPDNDSRLPQIDISYNDLRSYLSSPRKGATVATLRLSTPSDIHLFPASMSMPTLTTRPTFSLVPSGAELEHMFPQTIDPSTTLDTSADTMATPAAQHPWILDFTNGGEHPGVVMSQSRMRDIELVVNPLSSMDHLDSAVMMSFGTGSWVDLLLNPGHPVSPERYTALYRSPTSAHPPLQLRLTAPEEPGFLLEKVPVNSMKEVWGILEVVREQCWLNEILVGCHWTTEGLKSDADELPQEVEASEDALAAILAGTFTPRKIPVNVFLPTQSSAPDPLFDTGDLDAMTMSNNMQSRRPKIVMTSPERPPISGLVEITVSYDETRPRGINVQVSGAIGADLKSDALEEICRRGGTLGLSGRVWANMHSGS